MYPIAIVLLFQILLFNPFIINGSTFGERSEESYIKYLEEWGIDLIARIKSYYESIINYFTSDNLRSDDFGRLDVNKDRRSAGSGFVHPFQSVAELHQYVPEEEFFRGQKKHKVASHRDRINEPYYKGGEKVFRPRKRPYHLQKLAVTYPGYTTTRAPGHIASTTDSIKIYRECDHDCPRIYSYNYGPICGMRYDYRDWKNHFQTFNNICELDYENCKKEEERPMWKIVHKGVCPLSFPQQYRMVWFNITRGYSRWDRLNVGKQMEDRANLFLSKLPTTTVMTSLRP